MFQSTRLREARPRSRASSSPKTAFQSTRLREARHCVTNRIVVVVQFQSTRLREARLASPAVGGRKPRCFNPRAYVRRDLRPAHIVQGIGAFQSTRLREARLHGWRQVKVKCKFQSTRLREARLALLDGMGAHVDVSIHAPT